MSVAVVPLGARIPELLKKRLDRVCEEHGLKMNFVVAAALEDKLGEIREELADRALARRRLQDAEFASEDEYRRYVKRRFGTR
ncbi:MAG: hypothetical protein A2Z34_10700 [Planctomycetes bacterium RBG_16_59_8]|nr:MAG: hypothetical protein A2Z34_10700 [Planctomycetes bacterium RBG_16_59_8]